MYNCKYEIITSKTNLLENVKHLKSLKEKSCFSFLWRDAKYKKNKIIQVLNIPKNAQFEKVRNEWFEYLNSQFGNLISFGEEYITLKLTGIKGKDLYLLTLLRYIHENKTVSVEYIKKVLELYKNNPSINPCVLIQACHYIEEHSTFYSHPGHSLLDFKRYTYPLIYYPNLSMGISSSLTSLKANFAPKLEFKFNDDEVNSQISSLTQELKNYE